MNKNVKLLGENLLSQKIVIFTVDCSQEYTKLCLPGPNGANPKLSEFKFFIHPYSVAVYLVCLAVFVSN